MLRQIQNIVETGIYVNDLEAAENFYHGILGLPVIRKDVGRHVFFQVGAANVLLAFLPAATLQGTDLPPHGATGPGHFALGIPADSLSDWRNHLQAHGIPVEQEVEWPRGGKSLYFRDPAGNSVELVTPKIWGLPSDW